MKITTTITIASSLLLAVGCANESRQARNTSVYSTSPYYGGTYSGSASESSGYAANASENQSANQTDVNVQQGPLVSQIRSSLENQADLAAVAPNIQISENNGSVTLSGMVQSEAQKQNIQSLVQQISGVTTEQRTAGFITSFDGRHG